MINAQLRQAVEALDLQPRGQVWTSLTYCVLDAVWSIGANYDSVVTPLVRRLALAHGDAQPTAPCASLRADPFPLDTFLAAYPEPVDLMRVTNKQRTSTRSGITKAEAALRYAAVMHDHGLNTRVDATLALSDTAALEAIDRDLARIPGDGVRRGYFWMLAGSDEGVKPDRMVLGFLERHIGPTPVAEAREVLRVIASDLSADMRPVTPWMVDHAIWTFERDRRRDR